MSHSDFILYNQKLESELYFELEKSKILVSDLKTILGSFENAIECGKKYKDHPHATLSFGEYCEQKLNGELSDDEDIIDDESDVANDENLNDKVELTHKQIEYDYFATTMKNVKQTKPPAKVSGIFLPVSEIIGSLRTNI